MTITDIQALWRTLPLSAANDFSKLDEQISRAPQMWLAVAHFLKKQDLSTLPMGRNEIGEGVYCNVQEYETKKESKFEVHRRYIDIQLLVSGEEYVWVAPLSACGDLQGPFDDVNDFALYASAVGAQPVKVTPESWLILYPCDAHKPCMTIGPDPQKVRKVVVKILFIDILSPLKEQDSWMQA